MNDIMRIINSFEESGLVIKGVSKTIKNEAKEQKEGFWSMFLSALVASLLGNILTCKEATAMSHGQGIIRAGEGIIRVGKGPIRAGQDF